MKRFKLGMVVRVTEHETLPELNGRTGKVSRLCHDGDSAWVTFDEDIPDEVRSFPATDDRRNNKRLYRDECEPA